MLAKDLIKILEKYPEMKVTIGLSVNDDFESSVPNWHWGDGDTVSVASKKRKDYKYYKNEIFITSGEICFPENSDDYEVIELKL